MVSPTTKERFVWRHTRASTSGEFAEVDLFIGESAAAALHLHPKQREDFRVEGGTLQLRVGREHRVLGVGDTFAVEGGTAHGWRNEGPGEVHVVL